MVKIFMKIIYSNIENNTRVGYNTIIKELGDHTFHKVQT